MNNRKKEGGLIFFAFFAAIEQTDKGSSKAMQLVLVWGIFALLEKHDIDTKDDAIHFTAVSIQLRKFYFQTAKGS